MDRAAVRHRTVRSCRGLTLLSEPRTSLPWHSMCVQQWPYLPPSSDRDGEASARTSRASKAAAIGGSMLWAASVESAIYIIIKTITIHPLPERSVLNHRHLQKTFENF